MHFFCPLRVNFFLKFLYFFSLPLFSQPYLNMHKQNNYFPAIHFNLAFFIDFSVEMRWFWKNLYNLQDFIGFSKFTGSYLNIQNGSLHWHKRRLNFDFRIPLIFLLLHPILIWFVTDCMVLYGLAFSDSLVMLLSPFKGRLSPPGLIPNLQSLI